MRDGIDMGAVHIMDRIYKAMDAMEGAHPENPQGGCSLSRYFCRFSCFSCLP